VLGMTAISGGRTLPLSIEGIPAGNGGWKTKAGLRVVGHDVDWSWPRIVERLRLGKAEKGEG
jgi:hypothetical protein